MQFRGITLREGLRIFASQKRVAFDPNVLLHFPSIHMCSGFRELSSDWVKRQRNDVILTVTKAKKE